MDERLGVAVATESEGLQVLLFNEDEMAMIRNALCPFGLGGDKSALLPFDGLPDGQSAFFELGGAVGFGIGGISDNIVLNGIPDGTHDMFGEVSEFDPEQLTVQRLGYGRRNDQDPADGEVLQPFNFDDELSLPDIIGLTIGGVGPGEGIFITSGIIVDGSTRIVEFPGSGTGNSSSFAAFPRSLMRTGERRIVFTTATDFTSGTSAVRPTRTSRIVFDLPQVGGVSVSMGPPLNPPSITELTGGSVNRRFRLEAAIQGAYSAFWRTRYMQPELDRRVTVDVTSGYQGGASTLDITLPDLPGFPPSFGLQLGVPVLFEHVASDLEYFYIDFEDALEDARAHAASFGGEIP